MDRRSNDTDYVLKNLRGTRQEVIAHPELFEPDALQRIDNAIASLQEAKREAKAA